MTEKQEARFDAGALRDTVGEKVFARGKAYHDGGLVEILAVEPARIVARVAGSEVYRTVLTGSSKTMGGECSCRAFEDWGYCKHMVAVALAVNGGAGGGPVQGAGGLAGVRQYLQTLDAAALREMLLELAERDGALYRRLEMAAAASSADDRTLEAALRKAVTSATRTHGFVEYSEARGWASGVQEALDAVAALVPAGRGGVAMRIAEHALARIESAMENIDDSDGHCGGLLQRAAEIHLAAARAANPDPVALAEALFAREMTEAHDTFGGAAATYAEVLGEAGLARYRELAAAAWAKLPPRRKTLDGNLDFSADHSRLSAILDFFAERDGDVKARIALRASDLTSPWRYLQLAEFCLEQGLEQEALAKAEEGLWIFEDERPDARLVHFTARLLVRANRSAEAEAMLWRAFEKSPDLDYFRALRKLGGVAARTRALAFLEARLEREPPSQWHDGSSLLIRALIDEEMFGKAWRIAKLHGASAATAESLARASEASHPAEALAVYTQRVEQLVNSANGYQEASRLIARMAELRAAAEQAAYVASLKERHRRKRNFMKLLG